MDGKGQAIRYIFLKKKSVDLFNECPQCFFIHLTSSLLKCLFPTCNQTKGSAGGSVVKKPPAMQETRVRFPGQENSLEKEMATHSSILTWRIPSTEEAGGLQCMRSQTAEPDSTAKQQQTKLTSSSSDTDTVSHTCGSLSPTMHQNHPGGLLN